MPATSGKIILSKKIERTNIFLLTVTYIRPDKPAPKSKTGAIYYKATIQIN